MTSVAPIEASFNDNSVLRLAREIAMDMRPLEDVLAAQGISPASWESISKTAKFQDYLLQFANEWNSAINTAERVKLKSLAFIEESLPEFYARAHCPKETLNAKVEVLKTVSRLAGLGGPVEGSISGERLSVTINLGADQQVKIEKTMSFNQTIEGDVL